MKKELTKAINAECLAELDKVNEQLKSKNWEFIGRLNRCQADIRKSGNFIALYSYGTLVAIYNESECYLYDVLRYTYGYTATSALHIAKFYVWLIDNRYTVLDYLRYYGI